MFPAAYNSMMAASMNPGVAAAMMDPAHLLSAGGIAGAGLGDASAATGASDPNHAAPNLNEMSQQRRLSAMGVQHLLNNPGLSMGGNNGTQSVDFSNIFNAGGSMPPGMPHYGHMGAYGSAGAGVDPSARTGAGVASGAAAGKNTTGGSDTYDFSARVNPAAAPKTTNRRVASAPYGFPLNGGMDMSNMPNMHMNPQMAMSKAQWEMMMGSAGMAMPPMPTPDGGDGTGLAGLAHIGTDGAMLPDLAALAAQRSGSLSGNPFYSFFNQMMYPPGGFGPPGAITLIVASSLLFSVRRTSY